MFDLDTKKTKQQPFELEAELRGPKGQARLKELLAYAEERISLLKKRAGSGLSPDEFERSKVILKGWEAFRDLLPKIAQTQKQGG